MRIRASPSGRHPVFFQFCGWCMHMAMSAPEIVTLVKDCILGLTAPVAAYVAVRGLNKWQPQLTGNTNHQLAKNILMNLYEIRDATERVRNPFLTHAAEPDLPKEKLEELDARQKAWYATVQEYERRWKPIPIAKARLDANLWEAEAVWGKATIEKVQTSFRFSTNCCGLWNRTSKVKIRSVGTIQRPSPDHWSANDDSCSINTLVSQVISRGISMRFLLISNRS
jgi:hypothetical protein